VDDSPAVVPDTTNELSLGFWKTTRSVDVVGTTATARPPSATSDPMSKVNVDPSADADAVTLVEQSYLGPSAAAPPWAGEKLGVVSGQTASVAPGVVADPDALVSFSDDGVASDAPV